MNYSPFWKRVVAYLIDSMLLALPLGIMSSSLGLQTPEEIYSSLELNLVSIMLTWIYFTLSEISDWQGTVGKKLMNIYVTDINGDKLTFFRAFSRQFLKIPSNLIFGIGFLFPLFTQKRQALHDLLAKTLILEKRL